MYEERTDWVDTPKPPPLPGETPVKAADILRWERAHAEAHEQLDGRLSESNLNATYAPAVAARRRAPSFVAIGDSITNQGTVAESSLYGESWPTLLSYISGGRLLLRENAGVAGDSVPMIADRISTDVIARQPGACIIFAGTNSTTKGQSHFDTAKADYENRIIKPLLAAGIEPMLCTIPPRDFSRTENPPTAHRSPEVYRLTFIWNMFIREMASKYRLVMFDVHNWVTDPATGNHFAGTTVDNDGVHMTPATRYKVAAKMWDAIAPLYPSVVAPLATDRYASANMLDDGVFLGPLASGTGSRWPTQWTGPADPTLSVVDPIEGDGLTAGKWFRIAKTTAAAFNASAICPVGAFTAKSGLRPPAVGDRIAIAYRYRVRDLTGDGRVGLQWLFRGAGGYGELRKNVQPMVAFQSAPSEGVAYFETTMPADVVDIRLDFGAGGTGTATLDIGQLGMWNLTAMGVGTLIEAR